MNIATTTLLLITSAASLIFFLVFTPFVLGAVKSAASLGAKVGLVAFLVMLSLATGSIVFDLLWSGADDKVESEIQAYLADNDCKSEETISVISKSASDGRITSFEYSMFIEPLLTKDKEACSAKEVLS